MCFAALTTSPTTTLKIRNFHLINNCVNWRIVTLLLSFFHSIPQRYNLQELGQSAAFEGFEREEVSFR